MQSVSFPPRFTWSRIHLNLQLWTRFPLVLATQNLVCGPAAPDFPENAECQAPLQTCWNRICLVSLRSVGYSRGPPLSSFAAWSYVLSVLRAHCTSPHTPPQRDHFGSWALVSLHWGVRTLSESSYPDDLSLDFRKIPFQIRCLKDGQFGPWRNSEAWSPHGKLVKLERNADVANLNPAET